MNSKIKPGIDVVATREKLRVLVYRLVREVFTPRFDDTAAMITHRQQIRHLLPGNKLKRKSKILISSNLGIKINGLMRSSMFLQLFTSTFWIGYPDANKANIQTKEYLLPGQSAEELWICKRSGNLETTFILYQI